MENDFNSYFSNMLSGATDKNWFLQQNQNHLLMRYTAHVNALKIFIGRYCETAEDYKFMMKTITLPPQKVEIKYKKDQNKPFYKGLNPFLKVKSNLQDAEDFIYQSKNFLQPSYTESDESDDDDNLEEFQTAIRTKIISVKDNLNEADA